MNVPLRRRIALPRRQGRKATTRTLVTCAAFSTTAYGSILPHPRGRTVADWDRSAKTLPAARAALHGLCAAYTDGSARFAPVAELAAVEAYVGGWFVYDRDAW